MTRRFVAALAQNLCLLEWLQQFSELSSDPAGRPERGSARRGVEAQHSAPGPGHQPAPPLQPAGRDGGIRRSELEGSVHSWVSPPQEEWAMHFSQMLTVNRSLLELHLGRTGLTDTGMEMLAEGLRQNHSLRCLDLRW